MVALLALVIAACWGCARDRPASGSTRTVYDHPLASSGALFSWLPQKVQNTVRAQTGSEQLREVLLRETPDGSVYEVHFQNKRVYPPLLVRADGSVLHPDLTLAVGAPMDASEASTGGAASRLSLADLPSGVMKKVQERAGEKPVSDISRDTWENRTVYVVTIQEDGRNSTLYLTPDGTVVHETSK